MAARDKEDLTELRSSTEVHLRGRVGSKGCRESPHENKLMSPAGGLLEVFVADQCIGSQV